MNNNEEKIYNNKENDKPSNISNSSDNGNKYKKYNNNSIRRRRNNNNNNDNNDNNSNQVTNNYKNKNNNTNTNNTRYDKNKKPFNKKFGNRNNSYNKNNNDEDSNNPSPKQNGKRKGKKVNSEMDTLPNSTSDNALEKPTINNTTITVDQSTNTINSVSSSSSQTNSTTDLVGKYDPQHLIETLVTNIEKFCKQNTEGSNVYNFNFNIIQNQTNEITKTSNEVNFTDNKQINTTNKINNTVNNQFNTTINNIIKTNYNVFNNTLFDYISHILDKGCVNENPTIRTISKVSKVSYIAFCVSVNFTVNTLIKTFKITKCLLTQFKDFDKIIKGLFYFIIFIVIFTYIYRNDYCWNIVKHVLRTVFSKNSNVKSAIPPVTTTEIPRVTTNLPENLSNTIPTIPNIPNIPNLSEINDKIQSAFSTKEILKYLFKRGTDAVYSAYNQTEHFIVDTSKSALQYSYKMVNTTTSVITDTTHQIYSAVNNTSHQIYSAINSTVAGSIPLLQKSSNKIQSAVTSSVSAIVKKEKINHVANAVKDTITQTTPKVLSSGNDVYQSVNKFINKNIVNEATVNNVVHKIKNIFRSSPAAVETTSKVVVENASKVVVENVKEMNQAVAENASTVVVNNNENTVKKFVQHITSKIYKRD